jgi:hypothetical protein
MGHNAFQCPARRREKNRNKQGNGKAKFKGTCNQCGKDGHKKANSCWDLEANKDKRPKNWKVQTGETRAAGVDESGAVEMLLGVVDMCIDCSIDDGLMLGDISEVTVAVTGTTFLDGT